MSAIKRMRPLSRLTVIQTATQKTIYTVWLTIMLTIVVFALSGCSSLFEKNQVLSLNINIARVVNEGDNGVPGSDNTLVEKVSHPISLRLYQLSDDDEFNQLGFIDLYESDRKVLADSLIRSKHLGIFFPSQQHKIKLFLNPATQYIAVLGEFSDYRGGKFKDIIPVAKLHKLQLSLIAAQSNVFLQTPMVREQ
ncbi:type VI secretion system lipoprotein TssJ [Thalassomonas sp. RHCl1]|uniref:type VI secretion system lipoprotein TssJ n=1 Tax=Thalassomonas sp. RHCl1 TaxID=2995320 RepID=UPI00248C7704|nr:type VI secretion system lipoprotein TssJ [Thalassomonas sp. RHCl1]